MNHKFDFSFHFKPTKLKEISKKLENQYKGVKSLPDYIIRRDLPLILKEIEELPYDEQEIIKYSKTLKRLHLNLLASEYPYGIEDELLHSKIRLILERRYNSIIGKRFWYHFQIRPKDPFIIALLSKAFKEENEQFLSLSSSVRKMYNEIFQSDEVIESMSIKLGQEAAGVDQAIKLWKIQEGKELHHLLWNHMIFQFIDNDQFIRTQNQETLKEVLYYYPLKDFKQVMELYLHSFNVDDFHEFIMQILLHRLGNPAESLSKWDGVSNNAINKVKQWLFQRKLEEFLDSERFQYWKKYIHLTNNVKTINDPPISAMYFGEFVVVEFANKGNAAYFYETVGFDRTLSKNLKTGTKVEYLKNQYAPYFINKLNHSGGWDWRFDQYMNQYLKGSYDFIH
ncbi:EH signature domain-containing protein [Filobacillus milosensis]|nr:EH signature domain-containing protein [Filobacillus milosensis]